jgi:hypothetical protein
VLYSILQCASSRAITTPGVPGFPLPYFGRLTSSVDHYCLLKLQFPYFPKVTFSYFIPNDCEIPLYVFLLSGKFDKRNFKAAFSISIVAEQKLENLSNMDVASVVEFIGYESHGESKERMRKMAFQKTLFDVDVFALCGNQEDELYWRAFWTTSAHLYTYGLRLIWELRRREDHWTLR